MRYLIAITLPQGLSANYSKIQKRYKSKNWNIALPPHITLIPPAKLTSSFKALSEALKKRAKDFKRFKIDIVGIDQFANTGNTIFAQVAKSDDLLNLQRLVIKSIEGHLEIMKGYPRQYHPHITLSNDLTADEAQEKFPGIEKLVSDQQFIVDRISLFRNGDSDSQYQKIADFVFRCATK